MSESSQPKHFSYHPDASDTLTVLISTHLESARYVITQLQTYEVSPLLWGILTCHYPPDQPDNLQEILWVLDVGRMGIRGYVHVGVSYPDEWVEAIWTIAFLKDFNHHIALSFVDFFAALREQSSRE